MDAKAVRVSSTVEDLHNGCRLPGNKQQQGLQPSAQDFQQGVASGAHFTQLYVVEHSGDDSLVLYGALLEWTI